MARHLITPLTFDDLVVDDEWESPGRTITEADVVAFAGLSGDYNPLHMDHELARRGAAIVMVSSDLPEALGMAHRVLVVRRGRIAAEFGRADVTPDKVISVATGAAA